LKLLQDALSNIPFQHRSLDVTWGGVLASLARYAQGLKLAGLQQADWTSLKALADRLAKTVTGNHHTKKRDALKQALHATSQTVAAVKGLPLLEAKKSQVAGLARSLVDSEIAQLLEHAREHLADADRNTCPVCGQSVNREALLASLSVRVDALKQYTTENRELERMRSAWRNVAKPLFDSIAVANAALGVQSLREFQGAPVTPELVLAFLRHASERKDKEADAVLLGLDSGEVRKALQAVIEFASQVVASEVQRLPPESAEVQSTTYADSLRRIEVLKPQIENAEQESIVFGKRAKGLAALGDALRRARQDVAQNLLNNISQKVAEYYSFVHPPDSEDEVTGAPKIEIQRRGEGTAHVRGAFNGKDVADPKWVYSDGHLDTVGICVFLALRKFRAAQAGDPRLMVLDDIILSIDLNHGRRLLKLLGQEFSDHQLIILTHNRLFAEWCFRLLPGLQRLCISGWTLQKGPLIGDYKSAFEKLSKSALDGTEPKQIALDVMNLMDEWLGEARYVYSLSLRSKRNDAYTMGDIWNPFVKTISEMQKSLGVQLGNVVNAIGDLSDLPNVRNQIAAHDNEFAKEFPLGVMKKIALAALTVVSSLFCVQCQEFAEPIPNRDKPVIVQSKCTHVRYVSMPKPSA